MLKAYKMLVIVVDIFKIFIKVLNNVQFLFWKTS